MTRITETRVPTKEQERMSVNRAEPSLEMPTTSGAHVFSLRSTCSMSEQRSHSCPASTAHASSTLLALVNSLAPMEKIKEP